LTRIARWSLSFAAAVMPLYVVRWHLGPIPTTLLENAILVTIALYVIAVVVDRAPLPSRTALDIPIALFLVAGAIGIFVAPDHREALGIFRAYLVEPIAIYYVATALIRNQGEAGVVLAGAAIGATLYACGEIFTFARAAWTNHIVPGDVVAILGINPNSVSLYIDQ